MVWSNGNDKKSVIIYLAKKEWSCSMKPRNLFSKVPDSLKDEVFETLLKTDQFILERIISPGRPTQPGEWYDQDTNEWVLLLRGRAGLLFEGEREVRVVHPGDYVHIPAHHRHRVEWTEAGQKTVWLALHYR
jgi:cupin 2 domain-containing protein